MLNTRYLDRKVHGLIHEAKPIEEAWLELVDHVSAGQPDRFIDTVRAIDVASDLASCRTWLTKTIESERPPRKTAAFWFGLFNPVREDKTTSDLYVSGAQWFDEDDDEWAGSQAYWPKNRYACSAACAAIYEAAYEPGGPRVQGEFLCLWYSCLAVALLCRENFELLLGGQSQRHVAAGFDDGNVIRLGVLRPEGFAPIGHRSVRVAEPTPSPTEHYRLELVHRDVWNLAEPTAPTGERVPLAIGQSWPADATFHSRIENDHPGESADLSLAGSELFVASRRFAEIVVELDKNAVQCVPLQIDGVGSAYVLLNVRRELPCSLSHRLSLFKILSVLFMPLKAYRILGRPQQSLEGFIPDGIHLFRLPGMTREMIVSRTLKERLEASRVSGLRFIPLARQS